MASELAALSQENRTQRQEITELRGKLTERVPDVKVSFGGMTEIRVGVNNNFIPSFLSLQPLSRTDVPLHLASLVSDKQIQDYNDALPDEETIQIYNDKLLQYEWAKNNGHVFAIRVENDGTAKANDIRISLKFPDGFTIIEKYKYDEMRSPERPNVPKNPIEEAGKRFLKAQQNPYNSLFQNFSALGNLVSAQQTPSASLFKHISSIDRDHILNVSVQEVSLRIAGLLHSLSYTFPEEIVVIPSSPGRHSVNVRVIHEDIPDPVYLDIPFVVTDSE